MDFKLNNKVVLITGAGAGIGFESAKALIAEGAKVVGADIQPDALSELGNEQSLLPITIDMSSDDAGERIVAQALEHFGQVDVLLNNAGVVKSRKGFLSVTDEQWHQTLNLNFMGYVRTARAVLPHMLERGEGVLLHVASEAARMPNPRLPDYSVSKAAIAMFSKTLASEFAPQGVRSNVIAPGFIRTAVYDREGGLADTLAREYGTDKESALQRFVEENKIPLGRLGTPEEVAALVVYLSSPQSGFVSGATFTMDGGITPVI